MADATKEDVAGKIQAPGFLRTQPPVPTLSDPIADTPMIVTLDELRTYDSDPRVTRNPKYDELKSSIRERGLDAPPPITRRPGEAKYIIRNGGNTRLSILRELWSETKDEQFYRIRCLFRPWPVRGEIVVLTGHLAENDLHGALTFVERALAVEKARLLYETGVNPGTVSQSELARRLTADGYPITQSQISRMQDTVRHVLPAIPTALYGGLGRDQIERITALRRAAARVHELHVSSEQGQSDFADLFQGVLAQFDGPPESFNLQRVRDELIGQLSSLLTIDYDSLAIELVDAETRPAPTPRATMFHVKPSAADGRAAVEDSPPPSNTRTTATPSATVLNHTSVALADESERRPPPTIAATAVPTSDRNGRTSTGEPDSPDGTERAHGSIIATPPETTDRVQAIRRLVADATGEPVEDFQSEGRRSVPVAAGVGRPACDVWTIELDIETLDDLRSHAAQLAVEIAHEVGATALVEPVEDGIGFTCAPPSARTLDSLNARASLMLLGAISHRFLLNPARPTADDVRLSEYLAALLIGERTSHRLAGLRMSDAGLIRLFRLIRVGRRILELQTTGDSSSDETPGRS